MNNSKHINPAGGGRYYQTSQLQFLKFLAFSLVFICHAVFWCPSWYPSNLGSTLAVSFFFIISGVCTGYTNYKKELKPTLKNTFLYVIKKVLKFYPLLFISTIILFILTKMRNGIVICLETYFCYNLGLKQEYSLTMELLGIYLQLYLYTYSKYHFYTS